MAQQRGREALTLADEINTPFVQTFTKHFNATLCHCLGKRSAVLARAEAAVTLSQESGMRLTLVWGNMLQNWVWGTQRFEANPKLAEGPGAAQRTPEEAISQMHQGLDTYQSMDAQAFRPYFLALLAEVYGAVAQTEEGLEALAEALAIVEKTGERYYEAELHRLKGELLLKQGAADDEVEACFREAIEVARRQAAKSWELRATVSLSRLLQQQGRGGESQQMLAGIYDWFTEGFDTLDLIEAKALSVELSG
ncbi:hypothetical protein KFU94_69130 [Chloroflexi bacterium TSY]|nr:hypothetical protein [Chloroflexi bacterium TSY]